MAKESPASNDTEKKVSAAEADSKAEGDGAKQRLEGKVDLALLNEDDDFEEFPAEEWDDVDPTTQSNKVWEDDWDDDFIEDDFSLELRAELAKRGVTLPAKPPAAGAAPAPNQPMET